MHLVIQKLHKYIKPPSNIHTCDKVEKVENLDGTNEINYLQVNW